MKYLKPDYDKILDELFKEAGSPSDWGGDFKPILEKHFDEFRDELWVGFMTVAFGEPLPAVNVNKSSLLEAIREGALNPVVYGDDKCPVCANRTDICSYCAKNFEG